MAREIERKFLVKGEYKPLAFAHSEIEQGYMPTMGGVTVRVRIRGDKGFLTIKGPAGEAGLNRYEFEQEVPVAEAHELMKLCLPSRVSKTRWLVRSGKHVVEVDEFHGDNEGLVVAEIELGSEEEAYIRPGFLGEEVTGDRKYYNSHLMMNPYKYWK